MTTYGVVEVYLDSFLAAVLDGGEWLASRPVRFTTEVKTPVPI